MRASVAVRAASAARYEIVDTNTRQSVHSYPLSLIQPKALVLAVRQREPGVRAGTAGNARRVPVS